MKDKQKIIGNYHMGFEQVQVVLREGDGGEFYGCPGNGNSARIKIGGDYDNWQDVVRVLLHEAFELAMFRNNARYEITGDVGKDSGAYTFLFTHPEFSNICGKVSELICECLPELAKQWKLRKKDKTK